MSKPTKTIQVGDTVKCIDPGGMVAHVTRGKHYKVLAVERGRQAKRNECDGRLVRLEGVIANVFVWRFEKVQPKPAKKSNPKSSRRKS